MADRSLLGGSGEGGEIAAKWNTGRVLAGVGGGARTAWAGATAVRSGYGAAAWSLLETDGAPSYRFGEILTAFPRARLSQLRDGFVQLMAQRNNGDRSFYETIPFRSWPCTITLAYTHGALTVTFEDERVPPANGRSINLRFVLFWEGQHYALILNDGTGSPKTIEENGVNRRPTSEMYGYGMFVDEVARIVADLFPAVDSPSQAEGNNQGQAYTKATASAAISRELVLAGEASSARMSDSHEVRFGGGSPDRMSSSGITDAFGKIAIAGLNSIHPDKLGDNYEKMTEGQRKGVDASVRLLTALRGARTIGDILSALYDARIQSGDKTVVRFIRQAAQGDELKLQAKTFELSDVDTCFREFANGEKTAKLQEIMTSVKEFYGV